jgi:peptide/nickel transport system substrate-binding protein
MPKAWPYIVFFLSLTLATLSISITALAATTTAVPFLWPANWSVSNPNEVQNGGTLASFTVSDYQTLNPFLATEAGNLPDQLSAGGLLKLDPATLEFVPYMATSYSVSNDKLVWTFKLRPGLKWSDGRAMIADDWVTTAKIHSDQAMQSNMFDSFLVAGKPIRVAKIDNMTVKISFPSIDATALEKVSFAPWPSHVFGPVYRQSGAAGVRAMWPLGEPATNIVSSGAFKLKSYRPSERVILVENPYFGEWNQDSANNGLPYLDGVVLSVLRDNNQALSQFLAGELDSFNPRSAEDLAQIQKAIDAKRIGAVLRPKVGEQAASTFIQFNFNYQQNPSKQQLFRSAKFRQAMSMLANRSTMIELALGGFGVPAYASVYGVFKDWQAPQIAKFTYNPSMAQQKLAELGYNKKNKDGYLIDNKNQILEFELLAAVGNAVNLRYGQIFTDEAKKFGVKVNFKPIDTGLLYEYLDQSGPQRDWQAYLGGLSGGSLLYPFGANVIRCNGRLHDYNRSGACLFDWEKRLERLFESGQREADLAKRQAIGRQIQGIQAEVQDIIYLVSPSVHFAWASKVSGEFPAPIASALVGPRSLELTWIAR